jgi:dTDP-4-amino-4,6-dideoxygalactose transaminase
VPFHRQPCFRYLGYHEGDFPQAEAAARDSLAIPIYAELAGEQQAEVAGAIARFVREPARMVGLSATINN